MTKRPKKQTTKKSTRRKVVRESSDEASSKAATIVAKLDGCEAHWTVEQADGLKVGDVRSVCMSVLNQDQTKGQRAPKKRRKAQRPAA